MKQSVIMLVLLIFSTQLHAFNHQDRLTGYWYHKGLDRTIRIIEKAEVLIVKGLPGKKESRFFDYIGHATYRDEGGNFIVVKNREQLVYLHKKSHEKFRFTKVSGKSHSKYDQKSHERHEEAEWDNNQPGNKFPAHNWQTNNGQTNPVKSLSAVEGSWQTEDKKYIVAMLETREGLKAKFSGTTRWVEYSQKDNRSFDFVDEKGNRYTFINDKEVLWTAIEGNRPPVRLYKISDEVQY